MGYAPDSGFILRDALALGPTKGCCASRGVLVETEGRRGQVSKGAGAPTTDNRQLTTNSDNGQAADHLFEVRNRVMFPIANEQGKVIAFTGRTLSNITQRARIARTTWRSTRQTSVPSGVLPGRRKTATGLAEIAS